MNDHSADPTVQGLRRQISEADRALLAVVNTRLELVARLKRHKDSLGMPFVDPDRERQLVEELARGNPGPLSHDGLRELYDCLLDLTKREVRGDGRSPD